MLILLGTDGNDIGSLISMRFGHSNFFIIYNTDTKNFESIEITAQTHHNHENLLEFIEKGVEVFIVGNIGPHAFNLIKSFGKKIFLARKMTAKDEIEKFLNGELIELNEPTAKKRIGHKHFQ